ncbi:MAG: hypothetical protein JW836_03825, partial [Deltaproteobacteria bacterium]|nr:hypothetical protein [Deltaproteobacteria bacterium]
HPDHELFAEFFGQLLLKANGSLIVYALLAFHNPKCIPKFLLRKPLHANKETATMALPARPLVDELVYLLPTSEVEIADAKIGVVR